MKWEEWQETGEIFELTGKTTIRMREEEDFFVLFDDDEKIVIPDDRHTRHE